jgi:hypothetical protein
MVYSNPITVYATSRSAVFKEARRDRQFCLDFSVLALEKLDMLAIHPRSGPHAAASTTGRVYQLKRVRYFPRRCICRARGQGFAPPKETGSVKKQALQDKATIEDKLISTLQGKPQSDWRKLLAFSKKWPTLAHGVFKRCADAFLMAAVWLAA